MDYLGSFDRDELNALVMLSLDTHKVGYLIAGAFFGVHCAILGYLLYKSALFPRVLGVLLGLASLGYLANSFTSFLLPRYEWVASMAVVATAGIAEVSFCLWLLIRGVRESAGDP